eukprot:scaffold131_cov381-Pinguiococcus_pyrenoidosus.AAC.3
MAGFSSMPRPPCTRFHNPRRSPVAKSLHGLVHSLLKHHRAQIHRPGKEWQQPQKGNRLLASHRR